MDTHNWHQSSAIHVLWVTRYKDHSICHRWWSRIPCTKMDWWMEIMPWHHPSSSSSTWARVWIWATGDHYHNKIIYVQCWHWWKLKKNYIQLRKGKERKAFTHMFRNSKKILKKYNVLTTFHKTLHIGRRRLKLSKDGIQRPRGAPKHVKNIKEKARQEYQRKSQEVSGRGHQQPQKRIVNDTLRNLHRKFYAEWVSEWMAV